VRIDIIAKFASIPDIVVLLCNITSQIGALVPNTMSSTSITRCTIMAKASRMQYLCCVEAQSKALDNFVCMMHDLDYISLFYYMMMNGTATLKDSSVVQEMTSASAEWWAKMNNSLANPMDGHANFQVFVMEGEQAWNTFIH
jgi:hypothetical protein